MKQNRAYCRYRKLAAYFMFIMAAFWGIFIIGASIKYGGFMWPFLIADLVFVFGGIIYLQQARAIQEEIDLEERVSELERAQSANYHKPTNSEQHYTSYTSDRKYRSRSDRRRR